MKRAQYQKNVTLYTAPRSFEGPVGQAQLRAIRSWQRLQPAPEILMLGDEDGMAEAARDLRVRHLPALAHNEHGTPLVSSIIQTAETAARGRLLCYINSDIILAQDFARTIAAVPYDRFLLIGRRRDLDPLLLPDSEDPDWEDKLLDVASKQGRLHEPTGIDYFVHPCGLWPDVPPFALGRTMWDNWLVFAARKAGVPVIDASDCVLAVHQNHDYSHHAGGEEGVFRGAEAIRNLELGGGYSRAFTIDDATHVFVDGNLKLALDPTHLRQRWSRFAVLHPWSQVLTRSIKIARRATGLAIRRVGSLL